MNSNQYVRIFPMKDRVWDIIIIGGGASGMIAAISAKTGNNSVLILEKNPILGKKITISGNGRCNFTTSHLSNDRYLPPSSNFLTSLFRNFDNKDTIDFFMRLGVLNTRDRFGRILPYTSEAITIRDSLKLKLEELGVNTRVNCRVIDIKKTKNLFSIKTKKNIFHSKYLTISTGGLATPCHGTTGDGYEFLKKMGHKIVKPSPTIVPIKIKNNPFFKLQGVKLDAKLVVKIKNGNSFSRYGEILFTKYGISGPAALDISLPLATYGFNSGNLSISFLPDDAGITEKYICERFEKLGKNRDISNFFLGIFPSKFIDKFLIPLSKSLGIQTDLPLNKFHPKFNKLIHILKNYDIHEISPLNFDSSRSNTGGIPIDEIDENMESKIVKNLFITGELINITGYSGGYNMQFAFSTGAKTGSFLRKKFRT